MVQNSGSPVEVGSLSLKILPRLVRSGILDPLDHPTRWAPTSYKLDY